MGDFTILAHNYVRPEVQQMADFVGDSLELARMATRVTTQYLVVAGVDFMAETAAILNPEKTVIHPDPYSRCAMAARITPQDIALARDEYPDVPVVTYVNSSAAVKAVSDICCTSANAARVVAGLSEKRVIFTPDANLAAFVARKTGKEIIVVPETGCCPVHHALAIEDIRRQQERYPGAELIVHPETSVEVQEIADFIGSTSQMIRYAKETDARFVLVGTEVGILPRMQAANPGTVFAPASPYLVCPDMKMLTEAKVRKAMESRGPVVTLDPKVRDGARRALERMLAVP